MQRRWFISYNSQDLPFVEKFEEALREKDRGAQIFFAPAALRAGGFWLPGLAREIEEATGLVLLVGERGLGPWQVIEYYEALDRRVREPGFAVIMVLREGEPAPGLPFLRQLHWVITKDSGSEQTIASVLQAAEGGGKNPHELWRYTAPYRGLAAMTEADADYFFGRGRETAEIISEMSEEPDRLPILIGNSGVGKSSLARAGVMAALMRQSWPENFKAEKPWPDQFAGSHRWCFLTIHPGLEPVTALVESFLETWNLDRTSTEWPTRRAEWVEHLVDGRLTLKDLLDQTRRRYAELQLEVPAAYFVYIDQGEELYVRASARQRQVISRLLADAVGDPRLYLLMSLRADFFGELQKDEALYNVHRQVNVAPLRERELREVVSRPAMLLGARFESEGLSDDIARRTAEESSSDAGALPLLSYLLDDMWRRMVERGDGVLRLPAQAIELGGVLVERANGFLQSHPGSEHHLRRIFTLKLATLRAGGEPSRRRAMRSEFSDEEWRLVSELADYPNRLITTVTPERPASERRVDADASSHTTDAQAYAEVAHEAIFRRWDKLREWIEAEREFLAWRGSLEAARRSWETAPDEAKPSALLMGFAMAQARRWSAARSDDIPEADRAFIAISDAESIRRRNRRLRPVIALAVLLGLGLIGWLSQHTLRDDWVRMTVIGPHPRRDATLHPGVRFTECARGCPEMIVIPPGRFEMGSPPNEPGHVFNEVPQHPVTIGKPIAVSRYEITFDDWDICAKYGDCVWLDDSHFGRGRQPVINVSWQEAQRYVSWLSRNVGKPYRLLSEAEYEYVARAGSTGAYPWGDAIGVNHADCDGCGSRWDGKATAPVGSFAPNKFGLYDMQGNVWEWVLDCYHRNYRGAPADGSAWLTGANCHNRVKRGGSWDLEPARSRSADRRYSADDTRVNTVGFRVARDISD